MEATFVDEFVESNVSEEEEYEPPKKRT